MWVGEEPRDHRELLGWQAGCLLRCGEGWVYGCFVQGDVPDHLVVNFSDPRGGLVRRRDEGPGIGGKVERVPVAGVDSHEQVKTRICVHRSLLPNQHLCNGTGRDEVASSSPDARNPQERLGRQHRRGHLKQNQPYKGTLEAVLSLTRVRETVTAEVPGTIATISRELERPSVSRRDAEGGS
jgi:hypothetical protein